MNKILITLISVFLFVVLVKGQDYNILGNDELEKGNYEKAIEYYTFDIQKYPGWGLYGIYFNRGLAYSSLMKYDEAIADYTKAIELEPDFAEAYFARGAAFDEIQKYDDAIADYSKALQLKTIYNKFAFCFRGVAYEKLKKYDEAIADLMMALQFKPESGYTMVNLSLVYYEKQSYDDSKLWMTRAIDKEPGLNEGMTGIEKLENEGWNFSEHQKSIFRKIFEMLSK